MAIAKITTWLNDPRRDYDLGVLLYNQYGKSELLKIVIRNGNSQYHQDRLFAALEELNPTLEEQPGVPEFKIPSLQQMPTPSKRYGVPDEAWEKMPDQVKDIYVNNSKLHRHSQLLFEQARAASTDQERLQYGMEILRERRQLNNGWTAIKDFHDRGKITEQIKTEKQASVQDLTIMELTKQSKNIPTYLSKLRKALPGLPEGKKKNKALLKIQEYEAQLESVNLRLEGMQ